MFFRAVRAVPTVKEVWMIAPTRLSAAFTPQEMDELISVMIERELRVRTDVREVELLRELDGNEQRK